MTTYLCVDIYFVCSERAPAYVFKLTYLFIANFRDNNY